MCVWRLCKHVGMLPEERRKRSGLVGEPETQGERLWSCALTLPVLGLRLSELAELPSVFVSTLSVFEERPSARGRMLHPFRWAPYSFGGASSSAPTAAPPDRNDAMGEAWAALSGVGDALREPRDAPLEARDALAIREDAVRRRERDSRRITGSSTTSPGARSISEAPVRTRGAALTTEGEPSRAPRGAVDGVRDAKREGEDARGEPPGMRGRGSAPGSTSWMALTRRSGTTPPEPPSSASSRPRPRSRRRPRSAAMKECH
jgi:hypothetical protein